MFDFITPGLGSAISGLLGAGSSLLGGMMGASGQANTNAMQMQLAQQQENFQEHMSSTAYQRGMADMKAAGLNPILAANLGGASSPVGAMPTLGNPGSFMQQGITSAGQAFQNMAQTKVALQQADKDKSATDLNNAQVPATQASTELTKQATQKAIADTASSAKQLEVQNSQIDANKAAAAQSGAAAAKYNMDTQNSAWDLQSKRDYGDSTTGHLGQTIENIVKRVVGAHGAGAGASNATGGYTQPNSARSALPAAPGTERQTPPFVKDRSGWQLQNSGNY